MYDFTEEIDKQNIETVASLFSDFDSCIKFLIRLQQPLLAR